MDINTIKSVRVTIILKRKFFWVSVPILVCQITPVLPRHLTPNNRVDKNNYMFVLY